ncbi:outer membrane protein assembly factor BamA [Algiphilus sp. W345]|uniref:Outer membrane protein assembly factor BamA n=1 Tax=Banduia mediterranea TaxID=3075609 RepID=A0ABU2WH98_9GAMM|nr:outer membrane protein assembly factor BamA [Algiphilus sp. W345]MDT0497258.1 outer membrane protein assembly factor BamA [Algiphilus sp. W345]
MLTARAEAFSAFTIRDIRAEGLSRLDLGTVLTYLPVQVGDQLNEQTARQSVRALYGSGLFQDVSLSSEGDTLIVNVKERPAITSFEITGNEKIGGDELNESLSQLGLAEGELFKRSLLDGVGQELRRQYYANGYYDVAVDSKVIEQGNNRVKIEIEVTEGKVTKIKEINIVGATAFPREELLEQFELHRTNWMPFQRTDRYSKQQLSGDLETLQSYYQDRGYLKFEILSVQVALSPDKKEIYITINVNEGQVYTVEDRRFSGDTILNEKFLEYLTTTNAGDTFSRKQATESADRIEAALSDVGYAFAEVTPIPEVEDESRKVTLNYFVQPGKRTYVHRIGFSGHGSTNDETLRREMRQLEAAPFSKSAVERSRVRLERLAFVESVEVDTQPVPGTDDLVDINYTIKERPPGSVQFGVGFSGSSGFVLSGSVTHSNFMGTGNRIAVTAENNSYSKQLSFSWTDPYFTEDGISQTISTTYRKSDRIIRYSSGFSTNTISANLIYGIPLSEFVAVRLGGGIEDTAVETFASASSDEVLSFVVDNGSHYVNFLARTGIGRDTRNRTIFASRGSLQQLNLDVAVPGSDLTFYTVSLNAEQFIPIYKRFFLDINGTVGYADGYGSTKKIPPYENFFAGGSRTVRGFRDGTLGPRDTPNDNPYGGKLRTTMQNELIIPLPFAADGNSTRLAAFFDIGNVFAEPGEFEFDELRRSAGIAFRWFTPFLGILNLSYSYPLNEQPEDEVDRFQITFGSGF